jgi:hypothetical protein
MPSARSRPSEPVETDSISTILPFSPSFITEPFPKARSICDSAASRARCLSPSSLPLASNVADISKAPYPTIPPTGLFDAAIGQDSCVRILFSVRKMFFLLGGSMGSWCCSLLLSVSAVENGSRARAVPSRGATFDGFPARQLVSQYTDKTNVEIIENSALKFPSRQDWETYRETSAPAAAEALGERPISCRIFADSKIHRRFLRRPRLRNLPGKRTGCTCDSPHTDGKLTRSGE